MANKHLTVVDIEEWSILFDGNEMVDQGHSTELDTIIRAARGEPFTLERIAGYDSAFDKQVSQDGDVKNGTKLSEILPLIRRR